MSDAPLTASAIMSWVGGHEDACEAFYADLAARFPGEAKRFQRYASQSAKAKAAILRTYQETVTDALETNFGFEGVVLSSAELDLTLADGASLADAAALACELEQATIALYEAIAEGGSLLATIPGAFRRANRRKAKRLADLQEMAE